VIPSTTALGTIIYKKRIPICRDLAKNYKKIMRYQAHSNVRSHAATPASVSALNGIPAAR
jgi:hypothetical protein